MEFGLSSSPELLRGKRFSALPKSHLLYPGREPLTSYARGRRERFLVLLLFPLTPALSPSAGERENRWQSLPLTERSRIADQLPSIPPFPRRGGEGRGEGGLLQLDPLPAKRTGQEFRLSPYISRKIMLAGTGRQGV